MNDPIRITMTHDDADPIDPCMVIACEVCPMRCKPDEFRKAVYERGMIVTIPKEDADA